jgi:hypothetical protein
VFRTLTYIRRQSEVQASKKFVEKQLDVEACKKTVEPNKGFVKNNNLQLEVEASVEIVAPSKLFVQNNNTKKKSSLRWIIKLKVRLNHMSQRT